MNAATFTRNRPCLDTIRLNVDFIRTTEYDRHTLDDRCEAVLVFLALGLHGTDDRMNRVRYVQHLSGNFHPSVMIFPSPFFLMQKTLPAVVQ